MSYPQQPQQTQPYAAQAGEPPLWAPYYGAPIGAAVKRFFKLDAVIPCHYGSFPIIDPNAAQLSGVLDLLAAKHRDRLASEVTAARATQADPGATAYTLAVLVERAMELAAVRSGTARLTYSWQAGVELVDARTGGALDLGTLANAACAGPVTSFMAPLAP